MSNVRISALPAGPALNGTELLEMSNSLVSQSTTAAAIVTLGNTYTADHAAAGFDIRDLSNLEFRESTGTPAGTVRALYGDGSGLNINTIAATSLSVLIGGTLEYLFGNAEANYQGNSIINLLNLTLTGTINFPDGVRQTFNPDATNSGLNVGAFAGDPSTPSNGDLVYNSTAEQLRARINGVWVTLGAAGIATLNGDATAAQVIAAGTGLGLVDAGATHTLSIDATVATLAGAQILTNKTIVAANNTLTIASTDLSDTASIVRNNAVTTYGAFRQTFGPDGTTAGLNVGENASDPSTPVNGDLYYQTGVGFRARTLGAWITLGTGGGGGEVFTWSANHDANGFALEAPSFADPTDTTKLLNIDLAGNATTVTLTLDINQSTTQTLTVPNITAADNLVTDNVAATLLSKTLGTGTVISAIPTISAGIKVTFSPNGTNPGLNVGSFAGDPSAPADGDLVYNSSTNELRARINAAWVTVGQPDTPWTVLHDAARFNLDNTGAIIFSLLGPTAGALATDPYIEYDTAPAPDALTINVPTARETILAVNGVEEYTFSSTLFTLNGNIIRNTSQIEMAAVGGPFLLIENTTNNAPAGTNLGEIRWQADSFGGDTEYANITAVVRNNASGLEEGELQINCTVNDTLTEFISCNNNQTSLTFFNREIAFTNGQGIVDPSFGREILVFNSVGTSAVNEIAITNALTGNGPIIEAAGGNADIDLNLRAKGEGSINFADDDGAEELLILNQITGAALNYIQITNALTGNGPTLEAEGANANVDLNINAKGTGNINLNSNIDAGANYIFNMPTIRDTNENELLSFVTIGSAVNYIQITNAITAVAPIIAAEGSDTNIDLQFAAKGTGSIVNTNSINTDVAGLLTIATAAITKTKSFHRIAGEGAAADTLSTINGGNEGDILVLRSDDSANDITVDEAGNIVLESAGSFIMTNVEDTLTLIFDGTNWLELSRSDNTA